MATKKTVSAKKTCCAQGSRPGSSRYPRTRLQAQKIRSTFGYRGR
jgi:hypothetical protein